MCNPVAAVMAITAIAGGAQQNHMAKKQERAAQQGEERQNALRRQQDNKRSEASSNYLFDVENAGSGGADGGIGNTFLTGSTGVANNQLNLGKNNILGG